MNEDRFDAQDASVDDLLRDAYDSLDDPEQTAPEAPDTPTDRADDFELDFGDAFDEYGEFDGNEPAPEQPEPEKPRRNLKRVRFPSFLLVIAWFALIVGLSVWAAGFAWSCIDDAAGLTRPDQNVEIRIDDNDTLDTISEKLKDAGAIEKEWLFKLYCKFSHSENYFDPGVYNINLTYDYHALVNNLMAGASTRETTSVMIMEGLDCFEIFDLLEENGVCSRRDLEEAAANYAFEYEFLQSLPYGEVNRLEGYLFPDTYEFYLNDEPENVLEKFLDNFENKFDEDVMELVEQSGYSVHQILSMASIIEGEAANDAERPDVASVMYNRIHNWDNPLLGMDSTVYYAAKLLETDFDTGIDSRYNTYRYPGLPAGPICNPGMSSILAALQPNSTDYFYFATAKDGLNRFFTNEDDFLVFVNSDDYIGN